jgi:LAS superfamily LD-carboxypeptidase LdcB
LPLPGTQRISSRPPIYGHAGADRRIQQLAEHRGYRLQVTPTVALGSYGGLTLAADAGNAWVALLDASRRRGTPLQGNSGYRSVADQREIFRRRLGGYSTSQIESGAADGAIENVLAYHSIPGYSRHHTGKTIDMSAAGGTNGSFSSSAAYQWLAGNNYQVAKSFGFIPNYPPGAGAQGPNPEPWEFVYVGVPQIRCAVQKVPLADPNAWRICGLSDLPIVGELTGDGIDDVLVYRAGTRPEGFFRGTSSRAQTSLTPPNVNGRYQPIVGDFRGDGIDDILWYAPGSAADSRWTFTSGGGHVSHPATVNGSYRPAVGDFDGNGTDDIFWHGPGGAPDSIWFHRTNGTYSTRSVTVNGSYLPVTGDFDGNGYADILWYAPGTRPDHLWLHRAGGTHRDLAVNVAGLYRPVAGDFDGNGIDDIFWYAAGTAPDHVWYQKPNGAHSSQRADVNGTYALGAGDHDADGYDDLVFLAPPSGKDSVWFGRPGGFVKVARTY